MFWQLLYHTLTSRSNIWQVFNVVSSYDWNERKGLTPEDSSIKFNCDEQWNSFVKYSLATVCSWLCKKGKSNRISVLDACLWSISSFVKEQSGLMGAILPQKTCYTPCVITSPTYKKESLLRLLNALRMSTIIKYLASTNLPEPNLKSTR